MFRVPFLLSLVCAVALLGCSGPGREADGPGNEVVPVDVDAAGGPSADSPAPLVVYVVNHPLEHFVRALGGSGVDVRFPAPAEVDPAYWSPDPDTVAAYQKADLILLNGAGYARWVLTAALPVGRVVDTSAAYGDRLIPIEEGTTHSHGPEGEHVHKGWVFTTWLDPTLAIEQARAVAAALVARRPDLEPEVERNLSRLVARLEDFDRRIASAADGWGDRPVIFSHPVYQYFERRYGWNGRSLHWEPGEPPSERQWRELESVLSEHPAAKMIWEGEPAAETVERLEGLGIESVVFAPAGKRQTVGDFETVMEANVARLEASLGR